jgi:hypothetical protein
MTPGLLTSAIGALLTFLAAFLTWATVELTSRAGGPLVGGGTRSVIGLQGDRLGKATLVLAIAALLLVALLAAPASRPWGWIPLATAGALIVVLAVVDLISISDASDLRHRLAAVPGCQQVVQCSGDRSAGIGVYLTILGGLAVLAGALLHAGLLDRALRRGRRTPTSAATTPATGHSSVATDTAATADPAPASADAAGTGTPTGTPTGTGSATTG